MMLDNAREHGVDRARRRARARRAVRGRPRRRRHDPATRTASCARCAPRSSSTPAARAGLIQNRLRLRVWDPILNKGAIWTYWEGAYRDTGRDEGATMVLQTADKKAGSGTSRCTTTSSASASSRRSTTCSRTAARTTSRSITKKSSAARRCKERVAGGDARRRLLRDQGLLLPRHAGRRRRLGAGRRRLRLPRSALFLRRAAGAASRASWPPTPSSKGWPRATRRRRSSASGGRTSTQGVDRMRRLVCEYYDGFSFGRFVAALSGAARHGHRPADRRPVQRPRGQGLAADGIALLRDKTPIAALERRLAAD